ncbi:hypothetical protein [Kineobactrum salinum]|uniref:Tetratricopeptide repeat protein n=1 Tax=Kineobactrum salinum TaxID=2708301 RepID=A0A6C0U1W4_9GAMM|nr:hypothetical protein [Kineobactrum salinum]QIB66041.1 hypothetical protein G3T16_12060 [Kineobactrum salinum]
MNAIPVRSLLLTAWLLAFPAMGSTGSNTTATSTADEVQSPLDDKQTSLRQAISALETEHGAYGAALPEQLLSLGRSLQQQGRHREALTVFKRGTHLARVTSGLYSPEQLPLLQAEIESLQVLQNYQLADARQRYLYRVQMRSLSDAGQRAAALVAHADWQRQAYLLALDEEPGERLLEMWELNRRALNDILQRQGERSRKLLPPLHGMLHAQYLISDYQWQDGAGFQGTQGFADRNQLSSHRGYRRDNYDKGVAVIRAVHDLERLTNADDPCLRPAP